MIHLTLHALRKMRTLMLLIVLMLSLPIQAQTKKIIEELDKNRREIPRVAIISEKGILISYMSVDMKGTYNYDLSMGFIFYDFDLNKKWKLDDVNSYSLTEQKEIAKLSRMFYQGSVPTETTLYTLSEDGNSIFMHDFVNNMVTVIDVATGQLKKVKSNLILPEDSGFINYSSDSSTYIVSYITHTNKKNQTEDFESKLYVARYTKELEENIQEINIESVGSSEHKVRLISSSSANSRKWQIMGSSKRNVLLQDSYLLHDEEKDQNYRRLFSVNSVGETNIKLIPFGDYDKKNERYYGQTFCNYQTNNKLYNIYISPQSDKTGNINVQVIDLDLNLLAETSIATETKLSKLSSRFDIELRAEGYSEIFARQDNSLYRIKIDLDYSKIEYNKTESIMNDCIKNYSKYMLDCYDFERLMSDYKSLGKFVANDEKNSKKSVTVQLYKTNHGLFLIKTPQVTIKPESFFEIYKFQK